MKTELVDYRCRNPPSFYNHQCTAEERNHGKFLTQALSFQILMISTCKCLCQTDVAVDGTAQQLLLTMTAKLEMFYSVYSEFGLIRHYYY